MREAHTSHYKPLTRPTLTNASFPTPNGIKTDDANAWIAERNARFAARPVGLSSKRWAGYTAKN